MQFGDISTIMDALLLDTYQVKIVLHEVLLESLYGKSALTYALDKLMVSELLPHLLNIRSIQGILNKAATVK